MPANDPNGQRFGEVADAYDRGRPSYPNAVVDWLLAGRPRRVLDLGAGTGKLTESLVGRCEEVVAVEPSEGMRAVLSAKLPTVDVRAGTAEHIPLPDASVEAILVAQAWHWVDPVPASGEVARVLAGGGVLGLVWNDRDESDPWIARLTSLLQAYGTTPDLDYVPVVHPPLGPLSAFSYEWTSLVTPDQVVEMVTSRSYVIALPQGQRGELINGVRELIAAADRTEDGRVRIPYVTRAYRTSVV